MNVARTEWPAAPGLILNPWVAKESGDSGFGKKKSAAGGFFWHSGAFCKGIPLIYDAYFQKKSPAALPTPPYYTRKNIIFGRFRQIPPLRGGFPVRKPFYKILTSKKPPPC